MRDGILGFGGEAQTINPPNPVDLVIDHSVKWDMRLLSDPAHRHASASRSEDPLLVGPMICASRLFEVLGLTGPVGPASHRWAAQRGQYSTPGAWIARPTLRPEVCGSFDGGNELIFITNVPLWPSWHPIVLFLVAKKRNWAAIGRHFQAMAPALRDSA